MIMTIEVLENYMENIISDIRDELANKGINDTKKASNSLRFQITVTAESYVGEIYAADHLEFTNKGRGAGKIPKRNLNIIENWVRRKLGLTDEREIATATYFIRKKIREKGTNIFLDNSKGIQLEKIIEKNKQYLIENVKKSVKFAVKEELNKYFKLKFNE